MKTVLVDHLARNMVETWELPAGTFFKYNGCLYLKLEDKKEEIYICTDEESFLPDGNIKPTNCYNISECKYECFLRSVEVVEEISYK